MSNIINNMANKLQKQQNNMNNIRNGRVNIMGNFIASSNIPLFEENAPGNNIYKKKAVSAIYESNPLQMAFFSKQNIENLQILIKKNVYIKSDNKHIIRNQDYNNLKIVMKSIYLQYGKNLKTDIQGQVKNLNILVLDYCVPNIISNIELYLGYKKSVSMLPKPLELPKYISDAGTRTNSNFIY